MALDYLILGAGVSGLSAGIRLLEQHPDLQVAVVDKEPVAGGLARSIQNNGFTLDFGPHRLYSPYPEIQQYWKSLLGDDLIRSPRKSKMYLYEKFVEYPFKPFNLLTSLPLHKGCGFLLSYFLQALKGKSAASVLKDYSYYGYLEQRFGRMIAMEIFEPYALKVWGMHADQLSSWILKKRVSSKNIYEIILSIFSKKKSDSLALDSFEYPRYGMQQLVDKMVEQFKNLGGKLLLSNHINRLDQTKNGWSALIDKDEKFDADHVISTLPVHSLVNLLGDKLAHVDKLKSAMDGLKFRKIQFFYVYLNKDILSPTSWYYFSDHNTCFSRMCELKNFSRDIGPDGKTVLCCEVPTADSVEDIEAMKKKVMKDLIRTGLVTYSDIDSIFHHEEAFCYPVYDLIFEAKMKILFKAISKLPHLISTGRQGLFHHNNLDHGILMGWKTADFCMEQDYVWNLDDWYFKEILSFEGFRIVD